MAKNTPAPAPLEAQQDPVDTNPTPEAETPVQADPVGPTVQADPVGPTVEGLALVDIGHLNAKCGEWITVDAEVAKHLQAAGAFDVNAPKPETEFL